MHTRRSKSIDLASYDLELERTLRKLQRKIKQKRASVSLPPSSPPHLSSKEEEEPQEGMADNHTLRELATPNMDQQPLCITYPNAEGGFELKSDIIHYLPKFHGFLTEDANKHLMEFHVYFYEGLWGTDHVMLDAASGGAFMEKTPTNAKALLKNIAGNTRQFRGRNELPLKKVNEVSANSSIELQLANLTNLVQQVMVAPKQKTDKAIENLERQMSQVTSLIGQQHQPGRFMKSKKEQTNKEILDTFRKVQVNLPFLDAIKQVPKYAKFLEELCMNKRRFNDQETMALSEEVSAVLQRKLPPKLKDAGSFTIPCVIGGKEFGRVFCDLGASINLMPYSVYESLNLGDLKETKVVIQLADRSNRYPKGLLKDVLVQENELIFPADFFVLEMEHDPMPTAFPLILGRPFLRMARTKIDVYDGTLTMEIDGESVKFRIFNAMRYPSDFESCLSIHVFDYFVQDCFNEGVGQDNLEKALVHSITHGNFNYSEHIEDELIQTVAALESLSPICGEDETLPVIISSQLIVEEREKLIRVLKDHKTAIAWSIADIKGINPATCMHRILLDQGAKPTREAQRRLNPLMMEVVKKEEFPCSQIWHAQWDHLYLSSLSLNPQKAQMASKKAQVVLAANARNKSVITACGVTSGIITQSKARALSAASSTLASTPPKEQEHLRHEPVITLASLRAPRK
ncbi:unnamed protein product [Malus baccata var. baccata]